ncbi:MAG: C69 family dipeptidase [Bacteroidales bacterium]|jgi:dipeptidase|nr:C69 family dipeptidase [Bacteroidales bacterium]
MNKIFFITQFLVLMIISSIGFSCTNFIVTKGASKDGSVMISYAADSHVLYGELYHYAAQKYSAGSILKIYEWDTGKYLGEIPQATETYNVVGNVNEYQVAIGETTYGGREELWKPNGIMDYGSLIYIALQRSKTAREAIRIIAELTAEYGYCSEGESFSIADKNEAWIFEMIGKGEGEKGIVWVARLIPDGYISGHANQARITTFPFQKKNNWTDLNQTVYHSVDVITFAKKKGYFTGKDADFSFSDTYNPVTFDGARFCDLRIWCFFNHVADGMKDFWGYATGNDIKYDANGYAINRMPLWIKPTNKISQLDMFKYMGDHLEGTELDMSKDFGSAPYGLPYRWRPMTWAIDDVNYVHERTTGTQQTGFSFVAQLRGYLPDKIGAVNWFGTDDCASTVYVPMIASITKIPHCFAVGNGDMMNFTMESSFWITNLVTNYAYTRYNLIHPEIEAEQQRLYKIFIDDLTAFDTKMVDILKNDSGSAQDEINKFSKKQAETFHSSWTTLFAHLFTKYMDGNVKTPVPIPVGNKYVAPKVEQPGYPEYWMRKIVNDNGNMLKAK